jgi:hypothetical protein
VNQDLVQADTAPDAAPIGHPTEVIMATWKRVRPFARERFSRDQSAWFWFGPILPSVLSFDPDKPPEISKMICFKIVNRACIRVIEGDGLMVEAWS